MVESIWRARPRELARRALADIVEDEIEKIRSVAPETTADLESKLEAFRAGFTQPRLAEVVTVLEAEPHLHLAIGYREMGLTDDALDEAAIALTAAAQLGSHAHLAAEILLAPGSLRSSLDETLAKLRAALFPD